MWNWIRVKHNHILQNPNRSRKKTYNKYGKAIAWYVSLLIREKKEWKTKWIDKTKIKANLRLKKYGIVQNMIDTYIEKKWYKDLLAK